MKQGAENISHVEQVIGELQEFQELRETVEQLEEKVKKLRNVTNRLTTKRSEMLKWFHSSLLGLESPPYRATKPSIAAQDHEPEARQETKILSSWRTTPDAKGGQKRIVVWSDNETMSEVREAPKNQRTTEPEKSLPESAPLLRDPRELEPIPTQPIESLMSTQQK